MKRFKLFILSAIINRVYYRKHSVWNLIQETQLFHKLTDKFYILNDELYYEDQDDSIYELNKGLVDCTDSAHLPNLYL